MSKNFEKNSAAITQADKSNKKSKRGGARPGAGRKKKVAEPLPQRMPPPPKAAPQPKRGGARTGAGRKPGKVSIVKRSIAAQAREHAALALQALADIVQSETAPHSARVAAANALLNRGYGRPMPEMDISDTGTGAAGFGIMVLPKPLPEKEE